MNKPDRFIDLPDRLRLWQKLLVCAGLFVLATGLRAWVLPRDGIFIYGTYYPVVMFVFFLCGRALGMAFVLLSVSAAMFLFTPPGKTTVATLVTGYAMALVIGVVIGEFFRILRANAAELRSLRARYENIIDTQQEWVVRIAPDGAVLYANPAGMAALGIRPQDIPGMRWHGSAHPDDLPAALDRLATLSPERSVVEIVSRVYNAQREVIWAGFSCTGIFDQDGRLIEIQAVARDITDRKRAELELLHFNETLERRVQERTAELVRAHREMESFSYSVSHDLRAPLRAVNGLATILLEDYGGAIPDGCVRLVERLRDAGTRMGLLVDGLLSLSRLERVRLPARPVDPVPLVHEAFQELVAQSGETTPVLKVGSLPPCPAQPSLLRQLWQNLLSNAIKHSSHRRDAVIEVGCDTSGAVPAYYVRDNGEGFDMRYAGKLFQAFERLHSEGGHEGHGIGLAIVKRIAEQQGGRAWAHSQVGVGATFYFTLAPEPVSA